MRTHEGVLISFSTPIINRIASEQNYIIISLNDLLINYNSSYVKLGFFC